MIIIFTSIYSSEYNSKSDLKEKRRRKYRRERAREREREDESRKKEARIDDNDDKFVDYLTLPTIEYAHTYIHVYVCLNKPEELAYT